jgi:hypothetical protein
MEDDRPYRSTAAARSAVAGPAIALMITSGLAVGLATLSLILNLALGGVLAAQGGGAGGRAGGPDDPVVNMVGGVCGASFGLIFYGIVFAAAMQMRNLRSWGFSLAGSIMALLPCSLCCILTLPFGIWAIVILSQENVKIAFR